MMQFAFVMSSGKLFQICGPTSVNDDGWTCARLFFFCKKFIHCTESQYFGIPASDHHLNQVPRSSSFYTFVHENSQFKYNFVLNLEPVKTDEVWGNTIVLAEVKDNLACHILSML